ncbi:tRNA (guanosine(46)-N7)-methyltransferase TrmB [Propioniciclava soli]|uniref:tRNA (guanine-N(7)-)-methyltransferase n=1 Tax=Propioniciclava soli TaxID=2775081 RepID=A0ABZ3C9T0_9ACTN
MPRSEHRVHREVVSYVRRSARMNPSQEKAWDSHAGRLVVDIPPRVTSTSVHPEAHVDWDAVFGRRAPLAVEIGSGRGEALVALAEAHPDWNIVAFEVFQPAVASTLGRIARQGVENVRIVLANGVEGLTVLVPPASLTELWTFFPDPWHKPRHHKRRLVSPDFAALVAARLTPSGTWRLATDWADYAEAMRAVLDAAPGLVNAHASDGGWAPRFAERPLTKYEARGLAAGRTVYDLTYVRADAAHLPAAPAEPAASPPRVPPPPGPDAPPVVGDLVHRVRRPDADATGGVPL